MNSRTIDHTVPAIEAADLGRAVVLSDGGQLEILRDISFVVGQGEAVAVVGASGSGKSTLLGLLAGLDVPTSGRVRVAGEDFSGRSEDERAAIRARLMGFVFQSFQLLPALTALENVMLPLELAGQRDARELALDWLARVGLERRTLHYPKMLSGGEQQRVALARAFATQPALLLADEPTGNLDATTGAAIIDLMFRLNAEQGTTLLLVTHDNAIAQRCGRQLKLTAGRLQDSARLLA